MRREQESYSILKNGKYWNFYPSILQMSMCGNPPYRKVKIIIDPEGDYYTWHEKSDDKFHFTHYHEGGVEICFAYGSKVETDRGRGEIKRCRIEDLGEILK